MSDYEIFTIGSLEGFEGNNSHEILREIKELPIEILTSIYKMSTNAVKACKDSNDLPVSIINHFNAIRITLAQELTERNLN